MAAWAIMPLAAALLTASAVQAQTTAALPNSANAPAPTATAGRALLRPPAPSAAVVFAGLELTPAQRVELGTATARAQAARATLVGRLAAGSRLTAAQIAGLARITAEQRAAIDAALTPAQRARLAANVAAAQAGVRAWQDSVARTAVGPTAPQAGGTR